MLEVSAGGSGPVIMLSGETGPASKAQLSAFLARQLAGGTRHLTVDASGLRFADPAGLRALVLAAVLLKDRGGSLVLLRPQEPVARALALTGAGHMFTIRGGTHREPDSRDGETGPG